LKFELLSEYALFRDETLTEWLPPGTNGSLWWDNKLSRGMTKYKWHRWDPGCVWLVALPREFGSLCVLT